MADKSLREALEESWDEQEKSDETSTTPSTEEEQPTESDAPDTERATEEESTETEVKAEGEETEEKAPKDKAKTKGSVSPKSTAAKPSAPPGEPAPEAWKPKARNAWTNIPTEAKQEILRREREMVQTLQQTSSQRQIADAFIAAVNPFEMMVRAENTDVITATRELFGQAAILRIGTPVQKAQLVANVIKRFGVPIKDLDALLVGEEVPDADGKLAMMLQQQLAPVREFMSTIEQTRQQRVQKVDAEADTEIDAFAADQANEFFMDVKDDMADLIEMAAKRGQKMSLKQAYDKAVRASDDIQGILTERKRQQVANARNAGSSLPSRGAPPDTGSSRGDSIRDDLLSAWEGVANR